MKLSHNNERLLFLEPSTSLVPTSSKAVMSFTCSECDYASSKAFGWAGHVMASALFEMNALRNSCSCSNIMFKALLWSAMSEIDV